MLAVHLDYAPTRRPRPSKRRPMSAERRDKIANWVRRASVNQVSDSMEVSLQCGNTERAALIAELLAARSAPRPSRPKPALRELRLRASWRPIADEVAARHGVAVRDMLSGWRSPHLVAARHEFWWRLNQLGVALAEIGRRTGGYDHTSVRHGVLVWAERVAMNG